MQPDLFSTSPRFAGVEYDPAFDQARLTKQIGRVWTVMSDGRWRTLRELSEATARFSRAGDPEASCSAQLRHLRRPKFGAYTVHRRARGDRSTGLYEYRLEA
jgi:hypothetical protein